MESLSSIIIVVHLLIVLALIVTVLLQRSEGGALGMGGGGGGGGAGGGLISARGAGNLLSRSTAILAVLFFITSIGLTVLARVGENSGSLLEQIDLLNSSGTTSEGGESVNAIESLLGTGGSDTPEGEAAPDGLAVPTE